MISRVTSTLSSAAATSSDTTRGMAHGQKAFGGGCNTSRDCRGAQRRSGALSPGSRRRGRRFLRKYTVAPTTHAAAATTANATITASEEPPSVTRIVTVSEAALPDGSVTVRTTWYVPAAEKVWDGAGPVSVMVRPASSKVHSYAATSSLSDDAVPLNVTTEPAATVRSVPASTVGGVVSLATNEPCAKPVPPPESWAQTVNPNVPVSSGVKLKAYVPGSVFAIEKFPRTPSFGSRISTATEATPRSSSTAAVIVVPSPTSTGLGSATAEVTIGGGSTAVLNRTQTG